MKRFLLSAPITSHTQLTPDIYALTFSAPAVAQAATPGQFVHVRCTVGVEPLLRRPFSIHDANVDTGHVTILYRVVGRGTGMLTKLRPGDTLDIMGPLGQGFSLEGRSPLLVGGGIGVAPLLYLAKVLAPRPVTVIIGTRTVAEAPLAALFAPVCREVVLTTDDGSAGYHGVATDVMLDVLARTGNDVVYACGPVPMLDKVVRVVRQVGITCQVSLEQHMACGIGICRGCTCGMLKDPQAKVCVDGPVFSGEEVNIG